MNFLLLLSALLSALTGVGASVRQPQVAQAVAQQGVAAVTIAARRVEARPAHQVASLAISALAAPGIALALPAREPAFASRRRE